MPELGPKNLSFIKELKHNLESSGFERLDSKVDLMELAEDYGEKFIGGGAEVVVVALNNDRPESNKVVAFNYRDKSPIEAKRIFYLHRFFSTLFPHNFPHFYASAGRDLNSVNENFSGTVRHDIKKGRLSRVKEVIKSRAGFSLTRFPFRKVKKFCRELGISVFWDPVEGNFIFGADGGEYYVDTLQRPNIQAWDIEKIIQYMKTNKYIPEDIKIVRLSVERLKELSKPDRK